MASDPPDALQQNVCFGRRSGFAENYLRPFEVHEHKRRCEQFQFRGGKPRKDFEAAQLIEVGILIIWCSIQDHTLQYWCQPHVLFSDKSKLNVISGTKRLQI